MLASSFMTPVVTVCIPTFRRLGYLKEAVAAAQAQTLRDIEVLISDDGQSEELKRWSESAERADSRIRYRKNEKNLGLGGNWNACVSAARGKWLVIQGDDDRLLPTFCETLLRAASAESKVLFSNHHVIDERGARLDKESLEWTTRYQRDRLSRGQVADVARCVWNNSVSMTAALLRADAVRRLGVKTDLNTPENRAVRAAGCRGRSLRLRARLPCGVSFARRVLDGERFVLRTARAVSRSDRRAAGRRRHETRIHGAPHT